MKEHTRYRLTGAIFLLALASIILPMIFDGAGVRVQQVPEITLALPEIPSQEDLDALAISSEQSQRSRTEIDAAKAPFDDDGYALADGTRLGDPELSEPVATAPTKPQPAEPAPNPAAPQPGAGDPAGAVVSSSAYAIQLASFADLGNAQVFRDRLNADGYQAWLSTTKRDGTLHTRVAIGPIADKTEANALLAKVSSRYELNALLVRMKP